MQEERRKISDGSGDTGNGDGGSGALVEGVGEGWRCEGGSVREGGEGRRGGEIAGGERGGRGVGEERGSEVMTEKPESVLSTGNEEREIGVIAAVETSVAALSPATSDPATSHHHPSTNNDPSSSHNQAVGVASKQEVGVAKELWAESSSVKQLQVLAPCSTPDLVVTESSPVNSNSSTPEDSFRSALSTPDVSLYSHSPIPPETHTAGSGFYSPIPPETHTAGSGLAGSHSHSPIPESHSAVASSDRKHDHTHQGQSDHTHQQTAAENRWYITFEQFISCVQTEPDLCQFFAEQNTIDLASSPVDPLLSPYTRTVLEHT